MASKEVYFGVDVHERESQVAMLGKDGTALLEKRLPTGKLSEFVSKFPAEEKHVAIESVGFLRPIYEDLRRIPSCSVSVANPSKVKLIAESKTKNDRSDSFILGDLLRTNYLPESYMADGSTMEKRYLVKDRVNYGLRRAQLKTSISWMLKRKGIKIKAPFTEKGREELKKLGLREIDIRLRDLGLTESLIKELDADIHSSRCNVR
ncbi:MAG: transposase [Nitrososphaerota archaeon]|nr:transposase [Nitrososphaerota archaeon]